MDRTTARERRERFRPTRPYLAVVLGAWLGVTGYLISHREHMSTLDWAVVFGGYTVTGVILGWVIWLMYRLSK